MIARAEPIADRASAPGGMVDAASLAGLSDDARGFASEAIMVYAREVDRYGHKMKPPVPRRVALELVGLARALGCMSEWDQASADRIEGRTREPRS